jgi:hypothetical protein
MSKRWSKWVLTIVRLPFFDITKQPLGARGDGEATIIKLELYEYLCRVFSLFIYVEMEVEA